MKRFIGRLLRRWSVRLSTWAERLDPAREFPLKIRIDPNLPPGVVVFENPNGDHGYIRGVDLATKKEDIDKLMSLHEKGSL